MIFDCVCQCNLAAERRCIERIIDQQRASPAPTERCRCQKGSEVEVWVGGVTCFHILSKQNCSPRRKQNQLKKKELDNNHGAREGWACMLSFLWHFNAELVCPLVIVFWKDLAFHESSFFVPLLGVALGSRVPALKCRSKYAPPFNLKCSLQGISVF